jgi:hypothetical protein
MSCWAEAFPGATAALTRLRRSWHLMRAYQHGDAAERHLRAIGGAGELAADDLLVVMVRSFPVPREPSP